MAICITHGYRFPIWNIYNSLGTIHYIYYLRSPYLFVNKYYILIVVNYIMTTEVFIFITLLNIYNYDTENSIQILYKKYGSVRVAVIVNQCLKHDMNNFF